MAIDIAAPGADEAALRAALAPIINPTFPPLDATMACDFVRDKYWNGTKRVFFNWSGEEPIVDAYNSALSYASVARHGGFLPGILGADMFSAASRAAFTNSAGFTVVAYVLFNDIEDTQDVLAVYNSSPGGEHRRLRLLSGNIHAVQFNGGVTTVEVVGNDAPAAQVVHRIAATFSPTETSLQFDDKAVETAGGVSVPDTLARADLGNADTSTILQGSILGVVAYPPQSAAAMASLDPLGFGLVPSSV